MKKERQDNCLVSKAKIVLLEKAVSKALQEKQQTPILVIGPSGSGKTTTIKHVLKKLELDCLDLTDTTWNFFRKKKMEESYSLPQLTFENKKKTKGTVFYFNHPFPTTKQREMIFEEIIQKTVFPIIIEAEEVSYLFKKNIKISIPAISEKKMIEFLLKKDKKLDVEIAKNIAKNSFGDLRKAFKLYSFWGIDENTKLKTHTKFHVSGFFHLLGKILYPKQENLPIIIKLCSEAPKYLHSTLHTKIPFSVSKIQQAAELFEESSLISTSKEYSLLTFSLKIFHAIKNEREKKKRAVD